MQKHKMSSEPMIPMPIKATPYEHQINAFNFTCGKFGLAPSDKRSRGVGLLMEMGVGKSLTSIAVAGALYNAMRIQRVLVVAPLSILGVWDEEFSKFADFEFELIILKGSVDKKKEQIRNMTGECLQVIVVNYESAWRVENELKHWQPDLIICDEGHKIKSHNITVSKSMHRMGERTKFKLLLTGTPVTNKALDVFSQYKFLTPSVFGNSFYAFRNKYFNMVGYGNYKPVLKKEMEQELTEKIHSIAFRATKAECLDLPDTTDIVRNIELEPRAMRTYTNLVKDSYAELSNGEITAPNILTKLLRLSQLTGGFICSDDSGRCEQISLAKLTVLEDIIDSALEDNKKIVVIARFVPELNAICKMLKKKHISYSLIMGNVKDRAEQVNRFQNDPKIKVFVGQIATAGLGITLTAASTMVFYSLDYSMSNFEQTKARIHRVGQHDKCTYIYLIAKNTVDEKVLKALKTKANLAKTLIDDYRTGINPFG